MAPLSLFTWFKMGPNPIQWYIFGSVRCSGHWHDFPFMWPGVATFPGDHAVLLASVPLVQYVRSRKTTCQQLICFPCGEKKNECRALMGEIPIQMHFYKDNMLRARLGFLGSSRCCQAPENHSHIIRRATRSLCSVEIWSGIGDGMFCNIVDIYHASQYWVNTFSTSV